MDYQSIYPSIHPLSIEQPMHKGTYHLVHWIFSMYLLCKRSMTVSNAMMQPLDG